MPRCWQCSRLVGLTFCLFPAVHPGGPHGAPTVPPTPAPPVQSWPQVIAALQKGLVADGPVTLVLERRLSSESGGGSSGSAGPQA